MSWVRPDRTHNLGEEQGTSKALWLEPVEEGERVSEGQAELGR